MFPKDSNVYNSVANFVTAAAFAHIFIRRSVELGKCLTIRCIKFFTVNPVRSHINTVTEILAKILGMLVAAIAVSIAADGIIGLLQDYGTIYSFSLNVK